MAVYDARGSVQANNNSKSSRLNRMRFSECRSKREAGDYQDQFKDGAGDQKIGKQRNGRKREADVLTFAFNSLAGSSQVGRRDTGGNPTPTPRPRISKRQKP